MVSPHETLDALITPPLSRKLPRFPPAATEPLPVPVVPQVPPSAFGVPTGVDENLLQLLRQGGAQPTIPEIQQKLAGVREFAGGVSEERRQVAELAAGLTRSDPMSRLAKLTRPVEVTPLKRLRYDSPTTMATASLEEDEIRKMAFDLGGTEQDVQRILAQQDIWRFDTGRPLLREVVSDGETAVREMKILQRDYGYGLEPPEAMGHDAALAKARVFDRVKLGLSKPQQTAMDAFGITVADVVFRTPRWEALKIRPEDLHEIGVYVQNWEDRKLGGEGRHNVQNLLARRVLGVVKAVNFPQNPYDVEGIRNVAKRIMGEGDGSVERSPLYNARSAAPMSWVLYQYSRYLGVDPRSQEFQDELVSPEVAIGGLVGIRGFVEKYNGAQNEAERVRVVADFMQTLINGPDEEDGVGRARHLDGLYRMLQGSVPMSATRWSRISINGKQSYTTRGGTPVLPIPNHVAIGAEEMTGERNRIDRSLYLNMLSTVERQGFLEVGRFWLAQAYTEAGGVTTRPLAFAMQELGVEGPPPNEVEYLTKLGEVLDNLNRNPDLVASSVHLRSGIEWASMMQWLDQTQDIVATMDYIQERLGAGEGGSIGVQMWKDMMGLIVAPVIFTYHTVKDIAQAAGGALLWSGAQQHRVLDTLGLPSASEEGVEDVEEIGLGMLRDSTTSMELTWDFLNFTVDTFKSFYDPRDLRERFREHPLLHAAVLGMPFKPVRTLLHRTSAFGIAGSAKNMLVSTFSGRYVQVIMPEAMAVMRRNATGINKEIIDVVADADVRAKPYLEEPTRFADLRSGERVRVLQEIGPENAYSLLSKLKVNFRSEVLVEMPTAFLEKLRGVEKTRGKLAVNETFEEARNTDWMNNTIALMEASDVAGFTKNLMDTLSQVGASESPLGHFLRRWMRPENQFGQSFREVVRWMDAETVRDLRVLNENYIKFEAAAREAGFTEIEVHSLMRDIQVWLTPTEHGGVPNMYVTIMDASAPGGKRHVPLSEITRAKAEALRADTLRLAYESLQDYNFKPEQFLIDIVDTSGNAAKVSLVDLGWVMKDAAGRYVPTGALKDILTSRLSPLYRGERLTGGGERIDHMAPEILVNRVRGIEALYGAAEGPVVVYSNALWQGRMPQELRSVKLEVESLAGKTPAEQQRILSTRTRDAANNTAYSAEFSQQSLANFAKETGLQSTFVTNNKVFAEALLKRLNESHAQRLPGTQSPFEIRAMKARRLRKRGDQYVEVVADAYYIENVQAGRAVSKVFLQSEQGLGSIEGVAAKQRFDAAASEALGVDVAAEGFVSKRNALVHRAYDLRSNAIGRTFFRAGETPEALRAVVQLEYLARNANQSAQQVLRQREVLKALEDGDISVLEKEFGVEGAQRIKKIAQNGIFSVLHQGMKRLTPEALQTFVYTMERGGNPTPFAKANPAIMQAWYDAGFWDLTNNKPTLFGEAAHILNMRMANSWWETLFGRAVMEQTARYGGPAGRFWNLEGLLEEMPGKHNPVLLDMAEPYFNTVKNTLARKFAQHRIRGGYDQTPGASYDIFTHLHRAWTGTFTDLANAQTRILKGWVEQTLLRESKLRGAELEAATVAMLNDVAKLPIGFDTAGVLALHGISYRMRFIELVGEFADRGYVKPGHLSVDGKVIPPGPGYILLDIPLSAMLPDASRAGLFGRFSGRWATEAGENVKLSTSLYIKESAAEALGIYEKLFRASEEASLVEYQLPAIPFPRKVKNSLVDWANSTFMEMRPVGGTFELGMEAVGGAAELGARGLRQFGKVGDALSRSKLYIWRRINQLFRGGLDAVTRNDLYTKASINMMDPAVLRRPEFWQASLEHYKMVFNGGKMQPENTPMGRWQRIAKDHGITAEYWFKELELPTELLKDTAFQKRLESAVQKATVDMKSAQIKLREKQAQLSEAQRAQNKPEIERLTEEIQRAEENIGAYYAQTMIRETKAATRNFFVKVLDYMPEQFEKLYERLEAGIDTTSRRAGMPEPLADALKAVREYFVLGRATTKDPITKLVAALFVAGDDNGRFAYGHVKFLEQVKIHGTLDLPPEAIRKILDANEDIAPVMTSASSALRGSRAFMQYGYWPFKMSWILAKWSARNPEAAAFYMHVYNQVAADQVYDWETSMQAMLQEGSGWGSFADTPWGLQSDISISSNPFPGRGPSWLQGIQNAPISAWLTTMLEPPVQAIGSSLKGEDWKTALKLGVFDYMKGVDRLMSGGVQVNPLSTGGNMLLFQVDPDLFNGRWMETIAGGTHVDQVKAATSDGYYAGRFDMNRKRALRNMLWGYPTFDVDTASLNIDLDELQPPETIAGSSQEGVEFWRRYVAEGPGGTARTDYQAKELVRSKAEFAAIAAVPGKLRNMAATMVEMGIVDGSSWDDFKRRIRSWLRAVREDPALMKRVEDSGRTLMTYEQLFEFTGPARGDFFKRNRRKLPPIPEGSRFKPEHNDMYMWMLQSREIQAMLDDLVDMGHKVEEVPQRYHKLKEFYLKAKERQPNPERQPEE